MKEKDFEHIQLDALPLPPKSVHHYGKRVGKQRKAIKERQAELQQRVYLAEDARYNAARALKKVKLAEQVHLGETNALVTEGELAPDGSFGEIASTAEVLFRPNPGPQTNFLAAKEREVLYGGAAGGGKTIALIVDPLRYCHERDASALIIRRTNDELREIIYKTREFYTQAFPGAKWSEQKALWTFPSGARIWLTYLEQDKDVLRYQGQAFTYIGVDELTQYPTPYAWDYLRSRLRHPTLPLYMRSTSNPGGPGHCLPFGEVLTPYGWKDIKDFAIGDAVYTIDVYGKLQAAHVAQVHCSEYSGELAHIDGQGLKIICTPNHSIAKVGGTKRNKNQKYSLVQYDQLPGQATILRSCDWEGSNPENFEVEHFPTRKRKLQQPTSLEYSDYADLVGWFLSEGCVVDCYKAVSIAQEKEVGRAKISHLLTKCGFKFSTNASEFIVYAPDWWNYFKQFGKSRQKFIPDNLKQASKSVLFKLFTSLVDGDGHWATENSGTYYTISKQLADDFQEIAIKLGFITYQTNRQRQNREGPSYEISFHKTNSGGTEILTGHHIYDVATETKRKTKIDRKQYSGKVYCLGIKDTHTFVVRQNGSVWVSGNSWVKKMFIDPAPFGQAFGATDIETGQALRYPDGHEKAGQALFQRRFIPANLKDNPYLSARGDYEAMLLSLPEVQRKQLLEGSWDIAEGAAFTEFDRKLHVVEPYEIPRDWRRFRAADYGYRAPAACLWFAIAPTGEIVVYRELYVKGMVASVFAKAILAAEAGDKVLYGVLDSSTFHHRGDTGPSIAEEMIKQGCYWRPADRSKGSRVAGKNEIHRRLAVNELSGRPNLTIFSNCRNLVAQLPVIPVDKTNSEDVDTKAEDHVYDALRYGLSSRPMAGGTPFSNINPMLQQVWAPADKGFGY